MAEGQGGVSEQRGVQRGTLKPSLLGRSLHLGTCKCIQIEEKMTVREPSQGA